jgi:hypothetical protein
MLIILPVIFAAFISRVLASINDIGSLLDFLFTSIFWLAFVITLLIFVPFGMVRIARTGSFGQAFDFSAIRSAIDRVGRVTYAVACIVMAMVAIAYYIICWGIGLIPVTPMVGLIFSILLGPVVSVFITRCISNLYDCSVPVPQVQY